MSAFAVTPSQPPRPAARLWLPLGLSLALHALLGLAAVLSSSTEGARAGGPVPVDTLVLDAGDDAILLDSPRDDRQARRDSTPPARQPGDDEATEEAFPAQVADPPIVTPVSLPPSAAPLEGAGGAPPVPGAGEGSGAGTGVLRAPPAARTVVYVIDRSLSMGLSGALALAKRELLAGIDALPADARFAVILYNRQAEPLSPDGQTGLLPASEANRAAVARLVQAVRAEGGTDHLAALRRAVALTPDAIFFVTDADEMTAEQVRNVALLNRGRAAIHAVELSDQGERRDETPLRLLARLSGGTYRVVPVK